MVTFVSELTFSFYMARHRLVHLDRLDPVPEIVRVELLRIFVLVKSRRLCQTGAASISR